MGAIYPVITNIDASLPFYVTGVGCQSNQEDIQRPLGFMHYQWAYCRSGKGILEIGGGEYTISENSGFFFRPEIPHKYYAVEEPWEVQWLTFDGKALLPLMNYLGFGMWETVDYLNIEYLDKIIENIDLTLRTGNSFCAAECSLLLYDFLIKIKVLINLKKDKVDKGKSLMLETVVEFMENNYSSDIALEDIAQEVSVTPSHLCRIFKKQYDMSIFKFLTNLRIQKSKEFLTLYPDMQVTEVARRSGFNDTSYFCLVFKRLEGITPTEFRGR